MGLARRRSRLGIWALVTLAGWAIHAANHVRRGEAWDLLWTCNVAPLLLALGCATRSPRLVAIPLCWLSLGLPLWLASVIGGGELIVTSPLVHVGALVIAVLAAHALGVPRGAWWQAILALAALTLLSRLITPPALNVNLAFGAHPGWEERLPGHGVSMLGLFAVCAIIFLAVEHVMRRVTPAGAAR